MIMKKKIKSVICTFAAVSAVTCAHSADPAWTWDTSARPSETTSSGILAEARSVFVGGVESSYGTTYETSVGGRMYSTSEAVSIKCSPLGLILLFK